VYRNLQQLNDIPAIATFKNNSLLIVAGPVRSDVEEQILADNFSHLAKPNL
jgi:hypothetical protein